MYENIVQLKMKSKKDGKNYLTDTLDTKGILRLIESVPSSKAEPFKLWLAKKHKPYGLKENRKVAKAGGEVAKTAREDLEQKLGETIISSNNNLNYQYLEENKKLESKDKRLI